MRNQTKPLITENGRSLDIELMYPKIGENINQVEIGLCDVRAADSIRISYDFDRDGWLIKQQVFYKDGGITLEKDEWREVAFVQAWGLEET